MSTGLDSSFNLIGPGGVLDPHWTTTTDPTFDPSGTAQTVASTDADWNVGWLADGPFSDWIARNASVSDNGPAPYTFTDTFDLTGYDPSSAAIFGSWAIDDQGILQLNGTTISTVGDSAWGGLTNFSVSSGFVPGLNTLSMTITNDDDSLEAVRLQGELFANTQSPAGTPEPGSFAFFGGLAATGLGFAIKRRRSR